MTETAVPYTPWTEIDYKNALYMKEHEPEIFAVRFYKLTNEIVAETLDFHTVRYLHVGVFPALPECCRLRVSLDEIISEYEADQKRKEEKYFNSYIKRFTGGLVPGDTVYTLWLDTKNKMCHTCLGVGKIEVYMKDLSIDIPQPATIKCPTCKGTGMIPKCKYEIAERKVGGIHFQFDLFENDVAKPYSCNGIWLKGAQTPVSLEDIYRTKGEAEEAAAKANAITRKKE